jgi:hypothetical protein
MRALRCKAIILLEIQALICHVIMLLAEVAISQVEQSMQLHIYHHKKLQLVLAKVAASVKINAT